MTQWTIDEPGAGSLDELDLRARQLVAHMEHAASLERSLRSAIDVSGDLWEGSGQRAWSASAASSASQWTFIREWGEAERTALRRYAAAVESIADRAARARAQAAEAVSERAVLLQREVEADEPDSLRTRVLDHEAGLRQARATLAELADERRHADDACVAAVEAARNARKSRISWSASHPDPPRLPQALASGDPVSVSNWWTGLDDVTRQAFIDESPDLIGNLEGIPYDTRDRANHNRLERGIVELEDLDHRTDAQNEQLAVMRKVEETLGRGMAGVPPKELISLTVSPRPRVAISVGDLDRAKHATFIVPGMQTTVAGNAGSYTTAAKALARVEAKVGHAPLAEIAVVAWLDYDAPQIGVNPFSEEFMGKVLGNDLARAGSRRLAGALDGLEAAHAASGISVDSTVAAHSYGTTVASLALVEAHADHVVFLGSAGIPKPIDEASDLRVPSGEVFATESFSDEWAGIGRFGSGRTDPTGDGFHAHVFSSDAARDEQGNLLPAATRHGPLAHSTADSPYSYLDDGSAPQYRLALAAMGRGDEIPTGGDPDERELQRFIDDQLTVFPVLP